MATVQLSGRPRAPKDAAGSNFKEAKAVIAPNTNQSAPTRTSAIAVTLPGVTTEAPARPVPNNASAAAAAAALAAAGAGADQPGGRGKGRGNERRGEGAEGHSQIDAVALCRLLSLLADKTRLRILWLLAGGERAVGAMTAELGLPQPTVSHHLAWLRTMHLVSPRRAGKNVFYALGRAARAKGDGSLSLMTADMTVTLARREAE